MLKNIPNNSKRKWLYELYEDDICTKKIVEVCVKPNYWENSPSFIVLPFSIDSAIYDGISGDLKIKSLLQTVKSYAKNKVLILLSECAHLHALSVKYKSYENAYIMSKNRAIQLLERFQNDFSGCEVAFWSDFVWKNSCYEKFKLDIQQEYESGEHLRSIIQSDVQRLDEYMDPSISIDKILFQEKSKLDLLEMLTGFRIMYSENYKVIIYPGSMPNAFLYVTNFGDSDAIFVNASIKVK